MSAVETKTVTPVPSKIVYLICGSRDFTDEYKFNRFMLALPKPDIILCGMAAGADTLGLKYAKAVGATVQEYPADWKKYGKVAGPIRNREMYLQGKPTLVLGFFTDLSSLSPGTKNMLNLSLKGGTPTYYAGTDQWVQVTKPI